jgi:hypothetical protein
MRKIMLNPENQKDKQRFEKMKDTEISHGRPEDQARQVAAREVKVLRDREGKSKDVDLVDEPDESTEHRTTS